MRKLSIHQVSAAILMPPCHCNLESFGPDFLWAMLEDLPSAEIVGDCDWDKSRRIIKWTNFFLTSLPSGRVNFKNRVENGPSCRVALPSHYLVTTFSIIVWILLTFKLPGACLHHRNCMQDRPSWAGFKSPYLGTDSNVNTGSQGLLWAAKPAREDSPVHKKSVPAGPREVQGWLEFVDRSGSCCGANVPLCNIISTSSPRIPSFPLTQFVIISQWGNTTFLTFTFSFPLHI